MPPTPEIQELPASDQLPRSSGDLEQDLARLRSLVERDRVEPARAFVKELVAAWPDSERVRKWAEVLAPPEIIPSARPPRSFQREQKWIREHAHEYPGLWIAVSGDRLVAADREYVTAARRAREVSGQDGALLYRQPGKAE